MIVVAFCALVFLMMRMVNSAEAQRQAIVVVQTEFPDVDFDHVPIQVERNGLGKGWDVEFTLSEGQDYAVRVGEFGGASRPMRVVRTIPVVKTRTDMLLADPPP